MSYKEFIDSHIPTDYSMTSTAIIKSAWQIDDFAAKFWSVIAPINNMAVMEVAEALHQFKKSKYCKNTLKMFANQTQSRIDSYDKFVIDNMKANLSGDRSQFWMDYNDEYMERMKPHLDIFFLSVLQVLTRENIPDRQLRARMVTSMALLDYSIGMFDEYFRKVEQLANCRMGKAFKKARLSYVQSAWDQIVDVLCRSKANIDMDNEPDVKLAFKIIESKAVDLNNIEDISQKELDLNPDIIID